MKVLVHKRVPRGWATIPEETTDFARVKAMREARKVVVEKAKAAGKCLFKFMKIGEEVYASCSGTLTELAKVGICVACLGRGCGYCDGTGECHEV